MESSRPVRLKPVRSKFVALGASVTVAFACVLTGCTLCQDCGDLDYPTYGGAWERTRRDSGRVGSIFDPAGARTAKLTDRDDAPSEDGRPPAKVTPEASGDEEATGPDDPKAEGNGNGQPSPSDRQGDAEDELRGLNLEDINVDSNELLPPDV